MRGPIRSVLIAAFAALGCMLAVGGSSAIGAAILEAKGGIQGGALRDDLTTPPSNAQYGADILAQNTKGILALTVGGAVQQKVPINDAFAGLQLHSNPEAKNCSTATAYATFVDIQDATTSAGVNSPVYADTLIDPYRVDINSDLCATNPGLVTISGLGLYFPTLAVEVRGVIKGLYEQPGANCAAGGVKLNLAQPGLLINGAGPPPEVGFSNGAGANAYLCFVSANNYLYPNVGKELGPLTGEIKKT
jgi:hypothetical protein